MTSEIQDLMKKAERSIQAAVMLFTQEDFDFAASRAYYAMFYMAEACLLSKAFSFSKHTVSYLALINILSEPAYLM